MLAALLSPRIPNRNHFFYPQNNLLHQTTQIAMSNSIFLKFLLLVVLPLAAVAQFDLDVCQECVEEAANGCTFCLKQDDIGNYVSVCSCDLEQVEQYGDCTDESWLVTTQRWIGCEMMQHKRATEGVAIGIATSVVVIFFIGLCVVLQFCYGCCTCKKNKRASSFKSTNDLEIS